MRASGLKWKPRPEAYGWVIVAALSVTETVTWGIVYYGFPVFLARWSKTWAPRGWQ